MPDLDDLRDYLGAQPGSGPLDNELLQRSLTAAHARIVERCVPFDDPSNLPEVVEQAIIMQAARLYRRRFSVGGFEGFGDLGIARVPSLDADIEDLLIRYIRYDFA